MNAHDVWLTPMTYIGASADGAEMKTVYINTYRVYI